MGGPVGPAAVEPPPGKVASREDASLSRRPPAVLTPSTTAAMWAQATLLGAYRAGEEHCKIQGLPPPPDDSARGTSPAQSISIVFGAGGGEGGVIVNSAGCCDFVNK